MHRFRTFHPITKLAFFAVIFAISMFTENPAVRVMSLAGAITALAVSGTPFKRVLKYVGIGMISVLLIGVMNCFIAHDGKTILFDLLKLHITLEAFYYGLSAGVMIVGVAMWCVFITDETDTDDLVMTLGKILPFVSVVITVTLRYIPEIIKKFRETLSAQKMLGIFEKKGYFKRALIISKVFMSVTERSVENAMDTASTMRARGYGLVKRSSARQKKWRESDTDLMLVTAFCAAFIAIGERTGDFGFAYYPSPAFVRFGLYAIPMIIACALLFFLPAGQVIDWRIRWQKSFRSRG